jgi:hypothetical protein
MEKSLRKFEVIATYPHSELEIGEILTQYYFETSQTGAYCYVTNSEIILLGKNMKHSFVENMPHIFKEIEKERSKVLTDEMKVCIKGDGTQEYDKKIIEYLKSLGGINKFNFTWCCYPNYYYIDEYFNIRVNGGDESTPENYKEITLKDEVKQDLKVGTILVAIDNLYMNIKGQIALVKGKEYTINNIQNGDIAIESELSNRTADHYFDIKNYKKYFKIKEEQVCYVGKKIDYDGVILLIIQQDKESVDVILDGKQEVILIDNIVNGKYKIID